MKMIMHHVSLKRLTPAYRRQASLKKHALRIMLRKLAFVALFIYFGIISSSVVNALPFHVVDDDGREIAVIYPIPQGQTQYISVKDLLIVLDPDGKQQYIAITQHLTLNIKGKRFDLEMGQTSVSIDREKTYVLPHPPILIDQEPMIPIEFVTELASQLFGFQAKLNETAQRLQIFKEEKPEIEEQEYPLEDTEVFLLIIDPGHGGTDTGVKSRSGLIEKNLTLRLARQLERICRENQIKVKLTRSSDKRLFPQQRANIANKSSGDLFISFHFNASFSPKQSGFRIYVNKPISIPSDDFQPLTQESEEEPKIKRFSQSEFFEQSKNVAQWIAEELHLFSSLNRYCDENLESIKLTGNIIEVPLVTLRQVYMPAVLIELGYLSNLYDDAEFSDSDSIDAIAKALFSVVQKFSQSK